MSKSEMKRLAAQILDARQLIRDYEGLRNHVFNCEQEYHRAAKRESAPSDCRIAYKEVADQLSAILISFPHQRIATMTDLTNLGAHSPTEESERLDAVERVYAGKSETPLTDDIMWRIAESRQLLATPANTHAIRAAVESLEKEAARLKQEIAGYRQIGWAQKRRVVLKNGGEWLLYETALPKEAWHDNGLAVLPLFILSPAQTQRGRQVSKLGDEQAFPVAWPDAAPTLGLTKHEHYAGLAMQGLCANADLSKYAFDQGFKPNTIRKDYARSAVHCADALIAELEKEAP